MDKTKIWIYDIETFLNCFTFTIVRADGATEKSFEVSRRKNEIDRVLKCMDYLSDNNHEMVGFNNKGFDYPVLHSILKSRKKLPESGAALAKYIFELAQQQINSFRGEQFGNIIKDSEEYVSQIDLYKIHHFDNRAKSTSLKMLEFNMRMDNIEDLPFGIEDELSYADIDKIIDYNKHDVHATKRFFEASESAISFRKALTVKYGRNFVNHNDGKIGKDYFQMKLEELGVKLTTFKNGKKVMKQTPREHINLGECLFDYYDFKEPAFIAIKDWFSKQVIRETKGVFTDIDEARLGAVAQYAELTEKSKKFKGKPDAKELAEFLKEHPLGWVREEELKATENVIGADGLPIKEYPLDADGNPDLTKRMLLKKVPKKSYWGVWREAETLNVVVNGFRFDFGTGGIHGSITEKVAKETSKYMIVDADVASMYPNIAIANRVYPEHLGEGFCDIYQDVYEQRKSYPKTAPENAMLKLALNSVYGDSNNQYSVFYDPAYTMKITLNGQLSLCLLAERLMQIEGLKMIAVNTDGLTVALVRDTKSQYDNICKEWEEHVGLQLEFVEYTKMYIRDVNTYIAISTSGKVKRKGAYQYEGLGWHQNQSALVIQMAAEAVMLHGVDLRDFIVQHYNKSGDVVHDFMLRTKVPRSSSLQLEYEDGRIEKQQNICRYYPATAGGKLVKLMPALEGKESDGDRRLSIESAWLVKTCNNMQQFDGDETLITTYLKLKS